ncbi:MAG: PTS sugar transporter subunit IIA [candidate division KSB1 bacterium]|nr:PTS sugar transporter subunit IIA [candidate division KSB1 bacterium]
MQVSEYIREDLILLDLKAENKADAIRKLIDLLQERGIVKDPDDFFREVMEREKLGTTAVGHGVALPHARTDKLNEIIVAVGRCPEGVDFGAEDGQPVHMIFLIGTPPSEVNRYLKLLAGLSRLLRQQEVRDAIMSASKESEIREALMDAQKVC